jgi:hypothetical protein
LSRAGDRPPLLPIEKLQHSLLLRRVGYFCGQASLAYRLPKHFSMKMFATQDKGRYHAYPNLAGKTMTSKQISQ